MHIVRRSPSVAERTVGTMVSEFILEDWNPSEATLRRWAYDEDLYLAEQDEDLVLHHENYLPLLLELAGEPLCPKAKYILACVDAYLGLIVLRDSERDLAIVSKGAAIAGQSPSAIIGTWGQLLERRLGYRKGIGATSRHQALAMGQDLLNGVRRQSDIFIVAENPDSWEVGLSCSPSGGFGERLSICKRTGKFVYSRLASGGG